MGFRLEFSTRDFVDPLDFPDVRLEVNRYSWSAVGGSDQASATAYGEAFALWELLNWLRAPVTIVDDEGTPCWWGYLHAIEVRVGAIQVGVSLDSMANNVAVVYSYVPAGTATVGTRATTSWAQDAQSVTVYGTKELKASIDGAEATDAAQARDTILATMRYPIPTLAPAYGRGGLSATLSLRGWWHTLDWTYYENTGTTSTATTTQIADIVTAEGQFLEGTDIVDASGISSSEYRDGDGTALEEIAILLSKGTTNDLRLLAEVTRERYLRVTEEPEKSFSNIELYLDNAGVLFVPLSAAPITGAFSPVGKWCQLRDWPSQINMGLLADPTVFFIEAAEFDVRQNTWASITPRGTPTPWELAQIVPG